MKKNYRSKRTYKIKGVKRAPRRTTRRYGDGLNVKLQHSDCVVQNVQGVGPAAFGPGCITQIGNVSSYFGNDLADLTGSFLFRLGDTLQWKQFNSMYDRVKLNGVKITFIPQQNVSLASPQVAGTAPTMKLVHDYDDANPPQSADAVWARQGKVFRLGKPFSVYVKPKTRGLLATEPQGSGLSFNYGKVSNPGYLDTASAADIPFFALKFGIRDWMVGAPLRMRISIVYYVSFRNLLWNAPSKTLIDEIKEDVFIPEEQTPCEEIPPEAKQSTT